MTTRPGPRCLALPHLLRLPSLLLTGLLLTGPLLSGCSPRIPSLFEITTEAAEPPPQALQYDLDELPYREYWTGLILLGDKVGFSHLRLEATPDGGYLLESEAAMNFKVLGYKKKVHLLARDWVGPKLQLRRFQYEHHIDDSVLLQEGEVSDGQLQARIQNSAGTSQLQETLAAPLYPGAAVNLYPLLQGLRPGAVYDYLVYDGQSLQISQVQQQVTAYESSDLFEGAAYKLRTTMGSDAVRTWIDAQGRPALEISSHNLLIAGLESEQRARRFLTLGALSKKESLINFSLVRGDRKLKKPRKMRHLELELSGLGELQLPGNTARQQCTHGPKPGQAVCRIQVQTDASSPPFAESAPNLERHLARTPRIPTNHPTIRDLAEQINDEPQHPTAALVQWLQDNIDQKIIDSHTALDVLERRAGECQGHSYLYTALARSLGLPTRIMNGLVYSEQHHGFLYHTWVESWNGDNWQAIDPTFGQEHADATHIALLEGETPAELAPLMSLLGRLQARILSTEAPPQSPPLPPLSP